MKAVLQSQHQPIALDLGILIVRIGLAVLMLTHGYPKFAQLLGSEPIQFASIAGLSPAISLGLAVFAEFICSLLLLVGFKTRLAVIPLMITMLVAGLHIHSSDPFAVKEKAFLYFFGFLLLFFTGGGKFSADGVLRRR